MKKLILFILLFLVIGCGGNIPVNHVMAMLETPANFPAAQPLTCTGSQATGGIICLQSDGVHQYILYQWSYSIRPDGHGSFLLSTETGNRNLPVNLQVSQISVDFSQVVSLTESHGTLNFNSLCNGGGLASYVDGGVKNNPFDHLLAGKTLVVNSGDSPNFVIPQVVYPVPIPVNSLVITSDNDNCATVGGPSGVISWTVNGTF